MLALAFLTLLSSHRAAAEDKSGVTPNTISLPKGPGSIEGLGESFQPSLNTGTAKYAIALKLPPGTAGHAPSLAMSYEGGGGNGPLGFGWQLGMACVQRRCDEGIPLYPGEAPPTSDDDWSARYQTFINEMKEELVPAASGFYQCKNEGAFIRYERSGTGWIGTTPDGVRLDFGASTSDRIQADTNRVFSWLIERETDTRGNTILYSYASFPGVQNTNQQYLSEIRYGPGAPPWANFHFVKFNYEDRSDWFEDCRPGFAVRTGKRLKSIAVGTQGPALAGHAQGDFNADGVTDNLVRRYDLEYLDYAGTNTHWSFLSKLTLRGADGITGFPPMTLGYAVREPPDTASAINAVIGGTNEPPVVMSDPDVEFADLNGDGLPDILRSYPGSGLPQRAYLNRGEKMDGAARRIAWAAGVEMGGDPVAAGYVLSSNSVYLADMNGDGLSDLAVNNFNGTVFYFANHASLRWATRQHMATNDSAPPSPFSGADVRTADLDFDKRIDIVESYYSGGGARYRIWFNIGDNHYSRLKAVTPATGFLFSDSGVHIADFNGDRVPDIVDVRSSSLLVTAGLGYGRFANAVAVPLAGTLNTAQIAAAQLQDINGDGLADLVIERAEPGRLWYWINRGNYTFCARKIVTGMPAGIGAAAVVRWADLNGDGATDLIYADGSATPKLRTVDLGMLLNGDPNPNLLTAISNGIGRVTLIGYEPSTKFALADSAAGRPWPDPMPFPVSVVASVTNLDSLGHAYATVFGYHDGYYDPAEKQFRGFARAEQVDIGDPTAPTLVSRSQFDTGRYFEPMKGKLLMVSAEQEDGRQFWTETNLWTVPPVTLYTGTNGTNVVFVHPTGKVRLITELGQGTPRRLESEFDYDVFGNQTTNADYGVVENGDRSAFNDERITVTEYAINTNAWILRNPSRQEISDENAVPISRTEYFYDDETFSGSNFGIVSIANLTLKREWIDPTIPAAYVKSARTRYDVYGNPVDLLDPLATAPGGAHSRQLEYDSLFHSYPVTETIHVGNRKEPLIFRATYDEGLGTVTASTDFNANTTSYGYDGLGRLTRIVKPYDSTEFPTVEYDYVLAVPFGSGGVVNYVETRQRDQLEVRNPKSEMYFVSRQYVDGLGRKLMTKTEAEPAQASAAPRVVISEATTFSARQGPARILNACFSTLDATTLDQQLAFEWIEAPGWQGQFHVAGTLVLLTLSNAHQTAAEYDATLRESRTINADGTVRRLVYEPLLSRSYDENDCDPNSGYQDTPTIRYSDGLGRLVGVEEVVRLNDDGTAAGNLRSWITRFGYDLNDQLTFISDSQGNVKTFGYDGLERKIRMSDPDRGIKQWQYDDASNLSETTDAKNQRITYAYDGANRRLTENYHDGLPLPSWRTSTSDPGFSTNFSVVYHYDTPLTNLPQGNNTTASARNVKGMLAWAEDLSGEEHTSYDARGRNEWLVKRIPDAGQTQTSEVTSQDGLVSYRTGFEYDSADRITRVVYPDNDEAGYRYNERRLVDQIVGGVDGLTLDGMVVRGIRYHPSGQQVEMNYGNGVHTTLGYDSRLRLKKLLTLSSQLSTEIVHFNYSFDAVSNIKTIEDRRPSSAVPAGDPRRNTQLLQYDDLYRLTRVQYSFNLPGQAYRNEGEINYRYDRIGNMLAQTSTLTNHIEKGLPVANLGEMDSGGSAGRWNRPSRSPADPPGPHALTAIRQPPFATRLYDYDANGNMTGIDGLTSIWDFKDRLVTIEDSQMRADYSYDYGDRRVIKRVAYKPSSDFVLTNHESHITTLYINKYFEVREHEAPIKYVWDGHSRVARVTGSLNPNPRVQRLRLFRGWNLCSLAVTANNAIQQLVDSQPAVLNPQLARKWDSTTKEWLPVSVQENLPAGTVLWLDAAMNATLAVTGEYLQPTTQTVPASGDFLPNPGLEAWRFKSAISAIPSATSWTYDASGTGWLFWTPSLSSRSSFPTYVAPGKAVFLRTDVAAQVEVPDSARRIRYYHQDHLETLVALTDATGALLADVANYPFGMPRNNYTPDGLREPYSLVQKENDAESSLCFLEARYYDPMIARFASAEPLATEPASLLGSRSSLQAYAYGRNNPLIYLDKDGRRALTEAESLRDSGLTRERAQALVNFGSLVDEMTSKALLRSLPGHRYQDEGSPVGVELTSKGDLREVENNPMGEQGESRQTTETARLGPNTHRSEQTTIEGPKGVVEELARMEEAKRKQEQGTATSGGGGTPASPSGGGSATANPPTAGHPKGAGPAKKPGPKTPGRGTKKSGPDTPWEGPSSHTDFPEATVNTSGGGVCSP